MPSSVYTPKYARFCELLIEERQRSGVTQTELAEELGRPQSFVSKYERGERRLDVVEFLEIAAVLGVEPCTFIAQLRDVDLDEQR